MLKCCILRESKGSAKPAGEAAGLPGSRKGAGKGEASLSSGEPLPFLSAWAAAEPLSCCPSLGTPRREQRARTGWKASPEVTAKTQGSPCANSKRSKRCGQRAACCPRAAVSRDRLCWLGFTLRTRLRLANSLLFPISTISQRDLLYVKALAQAEQHEGQRG